MAAPAALCPRHPDQPAATTCHRCGRFVCTICLNREDHLVLCDECYQRDHGGKASGRAVGALVLGLVGFNCMPLLGIPAIILANAELAAIERGEAPRKGVNLARGARVLGWIEIALMVVGLVIVLILVAAGAWDGFLEALDEP